MITVHTLASGSSGNAVLLSFGETRLLVDAGISCRRITAALRQLGLGPDRLDAILITHTHVDHIQGLQTLLKRTTAPVYGTARVCRELAFRLSGTEGRLREAPLCQPFALGGCRVTAFPVSHDAPGACGYRFDGTDGSVGVMTDTGCITEEAARILPGVDTAVLEANHDVETLCSGDYPYYLKKRILGAEGHLCNEDAGRFAALLAERGAAQIILAHLSRDNNTPAMALRAVEQALSGAAQTAKVTVAPRDCLSECHEVTGRGVCRK